MFRKSLLCAVLALSVGVPSPQAMSVTDSLSPMGANFWFFWDNQATWPFVDFFKQSRTFWSSSSSAWDDGRTLSLDSLGYPRSLLSGQQAATLVFWDQLGKHPAGQFVLLYDGDGDISVDMGAVNVASSAAGRIVVNVQDSTTGLRIRITRTNTSNPVRNIRFIAPGFEQTYQTQIFHPLFLQRLHSMKVLRFMDWLNTNRSITKEFRDYAPVNYQTQGSAKGVSPIHLIQLCNRLRADIWWNMPHQATDDCFRKSLELLRDSLGPCQKVYLEWSNEVWNGMFDVHGYCRTMGEQLGLGTGWGATHMYWAKRLSEMMVIAEQVFAGQMDRLVRVYATQVGNTGVLDGILNNYNGKQHADAVAVAPYFGGEGSTLDAVLASTRTEAAEVGTWIAGDKRIADANGLDVIAYESGLDVFGLSNTLQEQVRWDSRMKDIWKTYWTSWKTGGGKLIVQYTFCDPSWGILRSQSQDTTLAPGYMAAQEWITANPRWWTEPVLNCNTSTRGQTAAVSPQATPPGIRVFTTASGLTVRLVCRADKQPQSLLLRDLSGRTVRAVSRLDQVSSPVNGQTAMTWHVSGLDVTRLAKSTLIVSAVGDGFSQSQQVLLMGNPRQMK